MRSSYASAALHLPLFPMMISTLAALLAAAPAPPQRAFVNFETPQVSPLDLTPDGQRLLAVNTADGVLEVLDVSGSSPVPLMAVPVGVDPVSVRARTDDEAWVVNHVSDSISVVDLTTGHVRATLDTSDEPCDVVFAGTPRRAFVSCSQTNEVLVFDPANLAAAPVVIDIEGEEPRAMAVSADGSRVLVAIFESGNGSTILGGGLDSSGTLTIKNVVSDPAGPHGGQNPPPNAGSGFEPPIAPGLPAPPPVGLIVRKDAQGRWMDDNGGNWTDLVSGPDAALSDRPVGWDVVDNDIAVIDATTLGVSYVERLMNICMALGVNPSNGRVALVGTDATNEVRFEPNLKGVFLRVNAALVDLGGTAAPSIVDLNPHLDYQSANVPQAERDLSVGDPRAIVWSADGSRGYVAGLGSNNVIVIDGAGGRVGAPIEVGEGPTGLAIRGTTLYALNRFDGSISVIDTLAGAETSRVALHDATPLAIKRGRKHLYGTHEGSGLGHIACASCHVDARMDRLAWDLGDPGGEMKALTGQNLGMGLFGLNTNFTPWHPMKGPMTTQTLQDIIGKEPLHWRGDRAGLEEFDEGFRLLQGDDGPLGAVEMQEFEDFLASIHFPPNPYRDVDNSLPTNVDLTGFVSFGRFSPPGTQLPDGNPVAGLDRYVDDAMDGPLRCATCHTLPTGMGANVRLQGNRYEVIPPGVHGERHHALVSVDGSTQRAFKTPQTRNVLEKTGFRVDITRSLNGFGFLHDGSVPGVETFLSSPAFDFNSDQDLADMVAFQLCLTGSELPSGSFTNLLLPPGTASQDAHAGVGTQTTVEDLAGASPAQISLITRLLAEAEAGRVGLVAHGLLGGERRGAVLVPYSGVAGGLVQLDRAGEQMDGTTLLSFAAPGAEWTLTAVPFGSERRLGIDRDQDGALDGDERDAGSDPADPASLPSIGQAVCSPAVANSTGAPAALTAAGSPVVETNGVVLNGANLPPGAPSLLVNSRVTGFIPGAGGSQGNLCLGGAFGRYNQDVRFADPSGALRFELDLEATPTPSGLVAVMAGESWTFQAWYRDVNPTATSNFTDAVTILFE